MGYIKQFLGSVQRYDHVFREEDHLWAITAIAVLVVIWISAVF